MADSPSDTVACIGAGTVGAGWAAVFLAAGYSVRAHDPAPDGEARMRASVAAAWPMLEQLGLAPGADPQQLHFHAELEAALQGACFVQESAPDDKALKIDLLARIDAATPADVSIASSSSTFIPSELAAGCSAPERIIIGHPFVPVYLVPLVEVVAGEATPAERVQAACDFYTRAGKRALPLQREIEGYIANRLQRVLFDEAQALVEGGVCGWNDIEDAVTQGPGFRWPVVGPVLHRHLGGGRGGVRHMIDHFGWRGAPGSEKVFIDVVEQRWGDQTIEALEQRRDAQLLAILRGQAL